VSDRIVTTIGSLSIFDTLGRAHAQGSSRKGTAPARAPRSRRRGKYFDDGIDGLMGIADLGSDEPIPDGGIIVPILQPPIGPALAIPEPEAPAPAPAGSPAPARPSQAAWARGDGSYILQNGDTLWGLATTYLLSGPRWREIWNTQSDVYRSKHTPDKIFAGEILAMPTEAQAKARAMGLFGIGSTVLGRGFSKKQVALAAAGTAVGLGSLYLLTR